MRLKIHHLFTVIAFSAIMLLAGCTLTFKKNSKKGADGAAGNPAAVAIHEVAVSGISAIGNTASLVDKNFATAWKSQNITAPNVLSFDLAEPKVGSIVIWNGNCVTEDLYQKNCRAGIVYVSDGISGESLGEFAIKDFITPTVIRVNREFKKGSNGAARVTLSFDRFIRGSQTKDFCLTEISFWSGSEPETAMPYPIGDRAYFGARGPVRSLTDPQHGACMFRRDGTLKDPREIRFYTYKSEGTFIICYKDNDWGAYTGRAYDNRGRHHYLATHPWGDSSVNDKVNVNYDINDNVQDIKKVYSLCADGPGGSTFWSYVLDDNGNRVREMCNDTSGTTSSYSHTYTIKDTDRYGNWTSRTDETGRTEIRNIEYYND